MWIEKSSKMQIFTFHRDHGVQVEWGVTFLIFWRFSDFSSFFTFLRFFSDF